MAAPPESAQGIRGPIGLGFRVPLLVVSPFSRGGLVCSTVSDHTSLLRFVEARFGAEVPNLSAWRRSTTNDLTSAFNFAAAPNASAPALPTPSANDPRVLSSNCPTQPVTLLPGLGAVTQPYPVPPNAMPAQEKGTRARPSGLCSTHRLRMLVRRRRRRLADAYRVRVTIEHTAALARVEVRLNGRRLRRTRRARLAITVRPRRLRKGRNTLTVVVRDATGAVRRRRLHFLYAPRR